MSNKETKTKIDLLKVGIDMHSDRYVIVCQEDGLPLKSAQRFTPEGFFNWISKQRARCKRIVTCYEAGCFGYVAHRRLEQMGIENYAKGKSKRQKGQVLSFEVAVFNPQLEG